MTNTIFGVMRFLSFHSRITVPQAIALLLIGVINAQILTEVIYKLSDIAYKSYTFAEFLLRTLVEYVRMLT